MNKILSKAILTVVFTLTAVSANAEYTFSLFNSLGGSSVYVSSINNSGQIVGIAYYPANSQGLATLWNNGMATVMNSVERLL